MVVKIHLSAASARGPLDYNERKVAMGEADIVGISHIDRPTPASIYETFDNYESNPAISAKTGNLAFHMTVNPSVQDRMDDFTAVGFIGDLMDRLGYGQQPWVVYRHDDVGRTHYHVVSVRVDAEGRVISDSFQRRKVQSIMKELSPKYGFTIGRGETASPKSRLSRNADRKRVESIVSSCFGYSTSELHFKRMLDKKGIELRVFRTDEGRIYGALFDDRKSGHTFKCSELHGISSAMMRDALESGKWSTPIVAVESFQTENVKERGQDLLPDIVRSLSGGEKSKERERDIRKKKNRRIKI